jgi:hypothetical protein
MLLHGKEQWGKAIWQKGRQGKRDRFWEVFLAFEYAHNREQIL